MRKNGSVKLFFLLFNIFQTQDFFLINTYVLLLLLFFSFLQTQLFLSVHFSLKCFLKRNL